MPFITFIYKIGKTNKTYYGKYCANYISDDHEGLDKEVQSVLIESLKKYKNIKSKVLIGVISFSSNNSIPLDSSSKEIKCFDFYCDYDQKIYMNGKLL